MKLGMPQEFRLTSRYYQLNRAHAIRDVFDAFVEIITNSDDSYHRLFMKQKINTNGGPILVEIEEHRKGELSFIKIKDKAEGMTLIDMSKKLAIVGDKTSEDGDRGFMSRGLKDCTALGDIIVESIVNNYYYKCKLNSKPAQFIPLVNGEIVSENHRKEMGVGNKNGTAVTLALSIDKKLPRVETIIRDLPWRYSLRDILDENSDTRVSIRTIGVGTGKCERIVYYQPEGELLVNEKFEIPEYPQADCKLMIWRAKESFDDGRNDKFRKSGLLIKGKRAIHECSLLHAGLEKEDLARKYFGRLECEFIDELIEEFDNNERLGLHHNENNPLLLIDPNRQQGLVRDHPFTKALFKIPTDILKKLIEDEKAKDHKEKQEIVNENTKKKLSELAKAASKFLVQQIDELEEFTKGENLNEDAFSRIGILLFPKYFNIAVNETRTLTLYVNKNYPEDQNIEVQIWTKDKESLKIIDMNPLLRKHSRKKDKLICTFRVKGLRVTNIPIPVIAKCGNLPPVDAFGKVVNIRGEEHDFGEDFEFEYKKYTIKVGSKRTIHVYAKYPEIVTSEVRIDTFSSDPDSLAIKGQCVLKPQIGSNFAAGEMTIQAHRLVDNPIKIAARLNGYETKSKVKIIQKEEDKINIDIQIVDENLGNFRAIWADREGKPNLLKISSRHPSVSRYLGPKPKFLGQNEAHFKLLVAEIVTESICRKSLRYETQERPWDFRWADLLDDSEIADAVIVELQKRIKNFAPIAHNVMLPNEEIPKFIES